MKNEIIFISLFSFLLCDAHSQPILPKIKAQKNLCSKYIPCEPCDSSKRLPSICNSTNIFEARITIVDYENRIFKEVAISYDSTNKWTAIEAVDSMISSRESKLILALKVKYIKLQPRQSFDSIYNKLIENGVHTLPNQRNIGRFSFQAGQFPYVVSLKVYDQFRMFSFGDAAELIKRFPSLEAIY
jgi:hypothetical protein